VVEVELTRASLSLCLFLSEYIYISTYIDSKGGIVVVVVELTRAFLSLSLSLSI